MEIITLILIGLSLSIDAFTLSLAYGLLNIPKKTILLTSFSVGIFHFFMPLLGVILGDLITKILYIDTKYILIVVLLLILIEMIKSLKENEVKEFKLSILNIIIFSLLVSFDSFSLGIGLDYITSTPIIASIIFSTLSCTFTCLGFLLGKYLSQKETMLTKVFGIILLIIIIVYFFIK